ncbi:MAG: NHLP family bacteriocin export ABC transporter peptidase/permease/ATPase subunit [Acidimicrobiales bacterium]|nr:NHLP family bacteriocin export ABC transporter peptidase/permease/ATPase subunit [Acidimicrobiales bacterium]MXZ14958.1 NHLP family bacteriocin export ABC transporter peptidase/permease/ATPase subunit [Acidimicrobiales bacterium]MYA25934.1 NHLP family bacteriocin export ABC transporter peptidase/permease/ATPase subunit [Acidimicrobiales bacterium]MYB81351.1 NHLP family bacteriocin export ABC transporter peptidase/permease/ATPase subunit [Acidimicrobiales bacterium]MYD82215.1 NHLP family bact
MSARTDADVSGLQAPDSIRDSGRSRARTPVVPQMHVTECGAACLGSVLAHFGRWVPAEELRVACGVNRDGASAADLVTAAQRYGLRLTGWRLEPESLAELAMPVILHWEFNHFVVLEGMRRGRWQLNDPANGRRSVSAEAFDEAFTGVVLVPSVTADFRPGGRRRGVARRLWPWLSSSRGPLAFAAAAGLLLAVPHLALPLLLSVLVDNAFGAARDAWSTPIVAAFAIAGLVVYLLVWLQQRTFRKLRLRLAVAGSAGLLSHLLNLPAGFFDHRYVGDIASRVQLVNSVAATAAVTVARLAVEIFMSITLLVLMFAFDALLAAFVALIAVVMVVLMRVFSHLRTDQERQLRRDQAALYSIAAAGLRDVDTLRATAGEDDFFARWSGHQARELTTRQKFSELGQVAGSLVGFSGLASAVVVYGIGGWRVMAGEMTVGALVGFFALAGSFLAPVGRFVSFADGLQILEADLQRIDDVFDAAPEAGIASTAADPADPAGGDGRHTTAVATFRGRLRLAGKVELRSVTFGYRRGRAPLIDGFSLVVEPGQRVAVVGASGSGKSSLLSLIGGERQPWSGQVLFDDEPCGGIPEAVLRSSMAAVDQRVTLFAATVRENLTMWDPSIAETQVVNAAQDALIHDEIMRRDGGYGSMCHEGGRNFSGGQRQRLEIARALACDPTILLADEATSSLDATTERRIDDALRRRGMTCIIVAHRLSTIRDCDEIVVLAGGRIAQRGTHEQLIADADGAYAALVRAE